MVSLYDLTVSTAQSQWQRRRLFLCRKIETHTYTQNQPKKTKTKKHRLYFCSKENRHHHTGCFSKTLSSFQLAPPMPQLLPGIGCEVPFPSHLLSNLQRDHAGQRSPFTSLEMTSLVLHSHVTQGSTAWVSWLLRSLRVKCDTDPGVKLSCPQEVDHEDKWTQWY